MSGIAGSRTRLEAAVALAAVLAVVATGALAPPFRAHQWAGWLFLGLVALSLVFVWGRAGIFSFGQSAFFGIGGYAYGVVSINLVQRTGETLSALAAAVVVAALAAAVLGYFMFYGNVGDVYVAIITLATTLVLLTFMAATAGPQYAIGAARLGGYNGMVGIPSFSWGWPGRGPTSLTSPQFLAAAALAAAAITLGLRALGRRPFGRIVAALRENELRSQLLGYDTRGYKLATFTVGGAIAGLGGAGYAAWGRFINPAVFNLQQAALVIIWVLVGGRTSFFGAFVGVFLVQGASSALGRAGGGLTPIILGALLITVVFLLPKGLVPTALDLLRRALPGLRPAVPALGGPAATAAPISWNGDRDGRRLEALDLTKSFGGLQALRRVSLPFPTTGVHCLIGPNGAGKSTLFNLLIGRYAPSGGRVMLDGSDITRWKPHQRARRGLGIKLQIPSIYGDLSVFENLWLAAYARRGDSDEANRRAVELLDWLRLRERAGDSAGTLPHGEQQWLEMGMVLAADPAVVMLDEPTAGMSREETARTAELIGELASHAAVVVVEHDMDFVRRLDAPTTVLHQGEIFAQGSLAELRRNEAVLDIYLGRRADA